MSNYSVLMGTLHQILSDFKSTQSPVLNARNARHERNRAQSRSRRHGQHPGVNFIQDAPNLGFTNPSIGDPRLTQENTRHVRNRTYSQGQGRSPGFSVNQCIPNAGFHEPSFRGPNGMNSGNHRYPQEHTRHERSRTSKSRPQPQS